MFVRNRILVSTLVLIGLAMMPASGTAEDSGKNVILIGWDGAQRNHVKEQLAKNELPTLAALIKEGAFIEVDVISGATDTKAGWSQINTGYHPDKTGVYSNGRYQPIPRAIPSRNASRRRWALKTWSRGP